MSHMDHIQEVAQEDVTALQKAEAEYGSSWKKRGGVGAFMMLARKWDRIENRVKQAREVKESTVLDEMMAPGIKVKPRVTYVVEGWDIFSHIAADQRPEGLIDDIRDLRRYLLLVEAEMQHREACEL